MRAKCGSSLSRHQWGVFDLMDWLHFPNIASQMRHFCAYPDKALQLLYGTLSR